MNYFRYKLIDPNGEVLSGIIKLPYKDVLSAITHLERDGSIIIFVKKPGKILSFFYRLSSLRLRKRINRASQAELFNNMSMMLRSGVSLTAALEEAAESAELPELAGDINDMITGIQGGENFSQSAEKYGYIFPETVIYLIRIGEETGKLDEMLKNASDHLKNINSIVSDTKQALLYPSFVFISMGAGFLFWFYYVVPKILGLFKEMDVKLPPLTVFVMNFSYFVQNNFIHLILGAGLTVFTIFAGRKSNKRFRKLTDSLLLKLPLSGTVISASVLAFITEYFSLLINAGIDILRSVTILKQSIKNEVYRDKLQEVRDSLTRGESISDSFKAAIIFPPFVTRMLTIGEMSGTLSEQLSYTAEEYRKKLSIIVATIGKTLEPAVLVIAGAMFAIIIGALLLPVYDLVSKISG